MTQGDADVWNVQWINPNYYIANGIAEPVFMLERPLLHGHSSKGGLFGIAEVARLGTFWVPEADPIDTDGKWAMTKTGTHVRVPIFGYRTSERALASIWALGVKLGLASLNSLRQHDDRPPIECHMILGHECTDLAQFGCFRCYVGLAFRTE